MVWSNFHAAHQMIKYAKLISRNLKGKYLTKHEIEA